MLSISQELRQSVLQAAIQGRLTKQLQEDGDARDLLAMLRAEKSIKGRKTKQNKPLVALSDAEVPFDIPENWTWCRLIDLGSFSSGKTPDMTNPHFWDGGTVHWTTSKDMKSKYLFDSHLHITDLAAKDMRIYPSGTLVMVVRSGILKRTLPVCILKNESTINQDLKAFDIFCAEMSDYIYLMLKGLEPDILSRYTKRVTTVDSLKFDEFSNEMSIPLPPLAEQHRIVDKVDELMAQIDELEKIENELRALHQAFPGNMKAALLQAAMQGKLTEQLPEDGTAHDLLEQIQTEKQALIKAGRLKKEKSPAPITEDDVPFDIPENWRWAKFGQISTYNETKKKINATNASPDTWMLDMEDIEKGGRLLRKLKVKDRKAIGDKTVFLKGDILYSKLRPYLLKVLVADEDGICTPELMPFHMYGNIDHWYIAYYLKSPDVDASVNRATFGMKMPRVGTDTMLELCVPIPPLAEQKRIVERLDLLLPLCDSLESPL